MRLALLFPLVACTVGSTSKVGTVVSPQGKDTGAPVGGNGCIDSCNTPPAPPPDPNACDPGQVRTFRYAVETGGSSAFGRSGVDVGPSGAPMNAQCEPGDCGAGKVRVEVPGAESFVSP